MSIRLMWAGLLMSGLLMPSLASAQETEEKVEPIGYFLGFSLGQDMKQRSGFQNGDFDVQALVKGFTDGLGGEEPMMTEDELKATQEKIQALLENRYKEMVAKKKADNAKWLADNAKKQGVKPLTGGLQYKVIKSGNGKSPTKADTVRVHYTGKLTNGKVFDSSVQRGQPAQFGVGQVIPGWTMALQSMKVGDKWMLYIPSDLAYGERGSPPAIGANEVLVFEVELLGIL